MSPSGRQLVHADGTPALMVADTAWALPFRATPEQVEVYARDRQAKGFNAVLLMTVQPDMRAVGPRDRTLDEGFDVGFEDLPDGRLRELNPDYFGRVDVLLDILLAHDLVPVLAPVFQGFGWKGLDIAGKAVPPEDYARYCRYLVARYGARPVVYLVGADGSGRSRRWPPAARRSTSGTPTASPPASTTSRTRPTTPTRTPTGSTSRAARPGHDAEHIQDRVADMRRNTPAKGVLNLEPTYENTRVRGRGVGWWQGHEAWSNLCAGATMGVGYGAASLWQWRLHADEPGHSDYFLGPEAGWREALDYEGSSYVGAVGRIMRDLPFLDIAPDWTSLLGSRLLSVPGDPGELVLLYRESGRLFNLTDPGLPPHLTAFDPRTGEVVEELVLEPGGQLLERDPGEPRVYVFTRQPIDQARRT